MRKLTNEEAIANLNHIYGIVSPNIQRSLDVAFKAMKRPQDEREFIKIITQYFPDDIVTYPEYRGKPYYSIHYRENGEEFVGYGTYNPDVLSNYLRTYFFGQKGGAE